MTSPRRIMGLVALTPVLACSSPGDSIQPAVPAEQLPSWNDGDVKQQILEFVARVSDADSPDFVPEPERIATFDNDGTLWSEKPVYFQLLFAMDRIRELAPKHPEWKNKQPFKGVLEGDLEAVAASGKHGLLELLMASHTGMTTAEFEEIVEDRLATARHPERDRPTETKSCSPRCAHPKRPHCARTCSRE